MKKRKFRTAEEHLQEMLKDPEFKKNYLKEMAGFNISVKLIELRAKLKLTQAQLAKRLGTTQSVVSRLEDGSYNRCTLSTLRKIAEATGTQLEINFRNTPLQKAG